MRLGRGAVGVLGLAAIIDQLAIVAGLPGAPVVRFLSFFTIDSNLLASAVLLLGAMRPSASAGRDRLRGLAVFCVLITLLVYISLVASTDDSLGLTEPWVNAVVHGVVPVALVLDWLLLPPSRTLHRASALRWLAIPIVYFAYTMARGSWAGWYPYPFLNPGKTHGYSGVLATSLGMLVVMAGLALLVAEIGNRLGGARARPTPTERRG